jgi:ribosome-binding factor A
MGRHRTDSGSGPSQRQLRVGEQLRHILAELLARGELRDPLLAAASLTVSEVRIGRDLRQAVVYVTELGGTLRPEVKAALERAASHLAGIAARPMHLKYAPQLSFRVDESFAQVARIDALLRAARRGPGEAGGSDG